MSSLERIPGGVVYEPRSLWSARTVAPSDDAVPVTPFNFNREHFRNGTRWPIEITRIAVSALNYIYTVDGVGGYGGGVDTTLGILARSTIRIGVPFRQRYMPNEFNISSLTPRAVGEPGGLDSTVSSTIFSQARLNFPDNKPLIVPKTSALEMQLTSIGNFVQTTDMVPNGTSISTHVVFHEAGGLWGGSGRSVNLALPVYSSNSANDLGGNGQNNDTNENLPYGIPPNFGVGSYSYGQFIDPRGRFTGKEWTQQEATRSGATRILSNSICFDQKTYDELLYTRGFRGRFAPLSSRVGSSVRFLNCGSQAHWWRPGCPLALSHDSISSTAVVYDLPQPLTLQPGDTFDVQATVPGVDYGGNFGLSGSGSCAERYQLGISFNGTAAIES